MFACLFVCLSLLMGNNRIKENNQLKQTMPKWNNNRMYCLLNSNKQAMLKWNNNRMYCLLNSNKQAMLKWNNNRMYCLLNSNKQAMLKWNNNRMYCLLNSNKQTMLKQNNNRMYCSAVADPENCLRGARWLAKLVAWYSGHLFWLVLTGAGGPRPPDPPLNLLLFSQYKQTNNAQMKQ